MLRLCVVISFMVSALAFQGSASPREGQSSVPVSEHYLKQYNFSKDWFTGKIPVWEDVLAPYKGRPDLHYLEVGVYEGGSAIWMLENILTHPTSRLTGVDIFPGDLRERFLANVEISGFEQKVTAITGRSQIELRHLPLNAFDVIYIDGSHAADDVLADAALSWELLKTGGLLIFDDYLFSPELPDESRPQVAIDAFITAYRHVVEVVHHDFMVIVRKRENPCVGITYKTHCTPLGDYAYLWLTNELLHLESGKAIALSEEEQDVMERIVRARRFGQPNFTVSGGIVEDEDFKKLKERLGLAVASREGLSQNLTRRGSAGSAE